MLCLKMNLCTPGLPPQAKLEAFCQMPDQSLAWLPTYPSAAEAWKVGQDTMLQATESGTSLHGP